MKRLVTGGIALIALAVSGWSSASTLDIPELCGGLEILNDPENRVYRGQFKSKGVVHETALVTTPIALGGSTLVFYVWGEQPKWKILEAGCVPAIATEKGDTVTVHLNAIKARATYKFSGDEVSAQFKGKGTIKGNLTLSEMTVSGAPTAAAQQVEMKGELPLGQPPLRAVGDKSVWRNKNGTEISYEITAVDEDILSGRSSDGCTWKFVIAGWGPAVEWKNCSSSSGSHKVKRTGNMYPLQVGNTEKWRHSGRNNKGNRWSGTRKCEVKGTEKVTVPAGSFDTYHVVCKEPWARYEWHYSPELRFVVTSSRKPLGGSTGSRYYRELVSIMHSP